MIKSHLKNIQYIVIERKKEGNVGNATNILINDKKKLTILKIKSVCFYSQRGVFFLKVSNSKMKDRNNLYKHKCYIINLLRKKDESND